MGEGSAQIHHPFLTGMLLLLLLSFKRALCVPYVSPSSDTYFANVFSCLQSLHMSFHGQKFLSLRLSISTIFPICDCSVLSKNTFFNPHHKSVFFLKLVQLLVLHLGLWIKFLCMMPGMNLSWVQVTFVSVCFFWNFLLFLYINVKFLGAISLINYSFPINVPWHLYKKSIAQNCVAIFSLFCSINLYGYFF